MGYTHCYKLKSKPTQKKWDAFVTECKMLHENLPSHSKSAGGFYGDDILTICGSDGDGKPEFTKDHVWFNGNDDLSHETFYLDKESTGFNFCKTARKPYDLLVMACLIAASRTIGLVFASDGFTDYKGVKECNDLLPAMNFYNVTIKPMNDITGDEDIVTENELWLIRKKYKN